ncbi:hypothetical protein B0T21DRAFT_372681 [Apiosordaria backusii]|uniref:Uncharacterized protein n=1 Tax=Apiosordaria backusii TaxID=314023 RepID=A0AA40AXP4_9PEZI|nr:hypothetical protein B0T21DRAFT_372681 [Apiosordaria backusii]
MAPLQATNHSKQTHNGAAPHHALGYGSLDHTGTSTDVAEWETIFVSLAIVIGLLFGFICSFLQLILMYEMRSPKICHVRFVDEFLK